MANYRKSYYRGIPQYRGGVRKGKGAILSARSAQMIQAGRAARAVALRNARLRRANYSYAGLLGVEHKFFDTSALNRSLVAPTDASGAEVDPTTLNCISVPAQGDGEQDHDGKKIIIDKIQIDGIVNCASQTAQTASDPPSLVYIALVQDTQTNGAQLSSENVFTNTAASSLTAASPQRNMSYLPRFKVLAVRRLRLTTTPNAFDGTQAGDTKTWRIYLNCNIPVTFTTATTSVITAVTDNSLHIVAYTSSTTLAPTLSYNSRIRFRG